MLQAAPCEGDHVEAEFIEAGDLTVEDGSFDLDVFRQPIRELGETAKGVPVFRDQFAASILKVSERARNPSIFNS